MAVKHHPLDAAGLAAALCMPAKPMIDARRLLSIAESLVSAYLHDSADATDCPVDVRNEAIIRTAGHVQNRKGYGAADGRVKVGSLQVDVQAARSAVRQSGAAALLAPFVRRTA